MAFKPILNICFILADVAYCWDSYYDVTMSVIQELFYFFQQKWQRRFFILYEHGLLRYALDEMVSESLPPLRP